MAKQSKVRSKYKKGHRAVKPRVQRPKDAAQTDNHAARHEVKKARLALLRLVGARRAEMAEASDDGQ